MRLAGVPADAEAELRDLNGAAAVVVSAANGLGAASVLGGHEPSATREALGLAPRAADRFVTLHDFERAARLVLPRAMFEYIDSGADPALGYKDNRDAFLELLLTPRVLRGAGASIDTRVSLFGGALQLRDPFFISPFGVHKMAHPAGEMGTLEGACAEGVLMGVSQHATVGIERLRARFPAAQLWYQLYILRDRRRTLELVRMAERAGCSALVITVDSPAFGFRSVDARNGLRSLPSSMRYEHYVDARQHDDAFSGDGQGMDDNIENIFEPAVCWDDIAAIVRESRLPVVVKGVLHEDDAVLAAKAGARGVMLSNHGGRQYGSAPSALRTVAATRRALETLVHGGAVPQRVSVMVDGGVRSGDDVAKALALGADAVGVARGVMYALAVDGARGVRDALRMLRAELRRSMLLLGCVSPADLRQLRVSRLPQPKL